MPKANTSNKTREDYQAEQWEEASDGIKQATYDPQKRAEITVRREDEQIWALHRDESTDLTQVEARDRAQWSTDYPTGYNVSQSTISRTLSKLDKRMLTEPVEMLNMAQRTGREQQAGLIGPMEYDMLQKNGYTDYLAEYRTSLAKFLTDRIALEAIFDFENQPPEWALDRFNGLNPNLGREYALDAGFEGDFHDPIQQS